MTGGALLGLVMLIVMIGLAMMPSTVTAAPTMPVAIANTAAVRMTTA